MTYNVSSGTLNPTVLYYTAVWNSEVYSSGLNLVDYIGYDAESYVSDTSSRQMWPTRGSAWLTLGMAYCKALWTVLLMNGSRNLSPVWMKREAFFWSALLKLQLNIAIEIKLLLLVSSCHWMWLQWLWYIIWFSFRGANNGWYEIHNVWPWWSSARWFIFMFLITVVFNVLYSHSAGQNKLCLPSN